ncbi:hypothetical protein HK097_003457, partial [Rhizophlyctis rosea]
MGADTVPVEFIWLHGAGRYVTLTGDFDDWKCTIPMKRSDKDSNRWEATVDLDPQRWVQFKY